MAVVGDVLSELPQFYSVAEQRKDYATNESLLTQQGLLAFSIVVEGQMRHALGCLPGPWRRCLSSRYVKWFGVLENSW